jgi:hypothetical protein
MSVVRDDRIGKYNRSVIGISMKRSLVDDRIELFDSRYLFDEVREPQDIDVKK